MESRVAHLLLLLPSSSYRGEAFLEAAHKIGVTLTVGGDIPPDFLQPSTDRFLNLSLYDPTTAVSTVKDFAKLFPLDAVLGVNDHTTILASTISASLGLPANTVDSVRAAGNKQLMRERLKAGGQPCPAFIVSRIDQNPKDLIQRVTFPCVLKPLTLSGSCGVIRADDEESFQSAFSRIGRLLRTFSTSDQEDAVHSILIEDFIPGAEVAMEGLLTKGTLQPLALFDKPDPLDGPYFEETLYITPSRLPPHTQHRIAESLANAAHAIGLREGPVHGELRVHEGDIRVIEVAARSIGGKCSRMLEFGTGKSLEEVILLQALGREVPSLDLTTRAAGVMMIPIPQEGILDRIEGVHEANQVPGVMELVLTVQPGERLVPLPEGTRYLGFILARGTRPEQVEEALREAYRRLAVIVLPPPPGSGQPGTFRV